MVAVFVDCLLRSVFAADLNVESVLLLAPRGLCVGEYIEVETKLVSVKTRKWSIVLLAVRQCSAKTVRDKQVQ